MLADMLMKIYILMLFYFLQLYVQLIIFIFKVFTQS
jgi:hypothetical protein